MRKIGCLLFILSLTAFYIQPLHAQQSFFQIKINDQWGFMTADGDVLVPPVYEMVLSKAPHAQPALGYFGIFQNGKMGIYHQEKGELVPPRYDEVTLVGDRQQVDYIQILHEDRLGMVDLEGTVVQPIELDAIKHLKGRTYAIQKEGRWQVWSASRSWNLEGNFEEIHIQGDSLLVTHSPKGYSAWTLNGVSLLKDFPHRPRFFSSEFYAYEKLEIEENGEMVEDSTGETHWEGTYDTTRTWGLNQLHSKGGIQPDYDSLTWQSDTRLIHVFRDGKMGILDEWGNVKVAPNVKEAFIDSVGYIWLRPEDTWGILNPQGDTLFAPQFEEKSTFWRNVAIVKIDSSYGLINSYKEWLAEPKYRDIHLHPAGVARLYDTQWTQVAFKPDGRRSLRMKLIVEGSGEFNSGWVGTSFGRSRASGPQQTQSGLEWYWGLNRKRKNYGYGLRDLEKDTVYFAPLFSSYNTLNNYNLTIVSYKKEKRVTVGLVDHEKGKLLARPSWFQIFGEDFSSGSIARVRDSYGLYHLMNKQGRAKKLPRVTYLSPFDKGLALAVYGGNIMRAQLNSSWFPKRENQLSGAWGIITRNGKWILKPEYNFIQRFEGNLAKATKKGKWGVINRKGNEVVAPQYTEVKIIQGKDSLTAPLIICKRVAPTYHFLDAKGNLKFTYSLKGVGKYREGMIPIRNEKGWGFMNKEGKVMVEPAYTRVGVFHGGLASVRTAKGWGYIRPDGNWGIKPQFLRTYDFEDGIALVKYRYRYGYVKPDGSYLIPPVYKRAEPMKDGQAIVRKNKLYGIVGEDGKWIVRPKYTRLKPAGNEYLIRRNGKMGFLNRAGEEILPPKYARISRRDTILGCARVKGNKGWGMIDSSRNLVVPAQYDHVSNMDKGVCLVRKSFLYGAYSWQGEELLPAQYSSIRKGKVPGMLIASKHALYGTSEKDTVYYDLPPMTQEVLLEADPILKANMNLFDYSQVYPESEEMIVASARYVYDVYDADGQILHKGLDKVEALDQGIFSVYNKGALYYLDKKGNRIRVSTEPSSAQK
ncbi:MAG: WG repeat-containing protein [Bacteroidota bacterium]